MSSGAIWLVWRWDNERIVRLTWAPIPAGSHALVWMRACAVVSHKLGKDDPAPLKAYRSISLHSCMGNVVKKVTAELLSEEAERRDEMSDRQFETTKRRSAIDAASFMVHRAHEAGTNGDIAGALLMHIKAAFRSIEKGRLVNLVKVRQINEDLIQWTERFLSDRTVELIIGGNVMETH